MHKETVERSTLELIRKLQSHKSLKDFVLVGGTALALQLGHRMSIDIDLFSTLPFNAEKLSETLEHELGFEQESIEENTLRGSVHGIKVDIMTHAYKNIRIPIEDEGVRMASPEDIAAMKVNAICNSGERVKDFIDIYTLLKNKSIESIIDNYSEKYSQRNPAHAIKSLNYFEDVDLGDWPNMLIDKKIKWDDVTSKIRTSIVDYQNNLVKKGEQQLYQAIYENNLEEVNKLIKHDGLKPNNRHLQVIFEMQQKGIFVNPDIEKLINLNLPNQGKNISFS